jgi:hypothetical protein
VRRGSEPAVNKPGATDAVTSTSSSVQAVIASINARTTENQVPRSLSSNVLVRQDSGDQQQYQLFAHGGLQQPQNPHIRSSLRMTMVNRSGDGYYLYNDRDERSNQQSSPDSQLGFEESGSLSVMRRREPLGASGNKPERPK